MKIIPQDLNTQNKRLLSDLQEVHDIEFQQKDIEYCEVFSQNNKAIIYYNPKKVDNESIAHELLHIWLNTFNYISGNGIYLPSLNHSKLRKIFVKFLCDHIGNCIDHIKMYPEYIKMGYTPEKFLINALEEKSNLNDMIILDLKNGNNIYYSKAIEIFIGNLISIYADHVENDYTKHLQVLRIKDENLFNIVTKFWNSWENFDISNIDVIFNSDKDLMFNFVEDMEIWVNDKNVM